VAVEKQLKFLLMKTKSIFACAGASVMGIASVWSVAAAPLAAYLIISVFTELASYWLALVVVLGGGWLYLRNQNQPVASTSFFGRRLAVGLALAVVIGSWSLSDRQFFFWKKKAIPSIAWPQMVSDLKEIGKRAAENGTNILSSRTPLPTSLQQLGSREDYSGGMGNVWNTPEYTGAVAGVVFGSRVRRWGLCVGPEKIAKEYCRGGGYMNVAPNAYFFFGTKD
jgi:hypothetical protein